MSQMGLVDLLDLPGGYFSVSEYAVGMYTVSSWENPHIGFPTCEEPLWQET